MLTLLDFLEVTLSIYCTQQRTNPRRFQLCCPVHQEQHPSCYLYLDDLSPEEIDAGLGTLHCYACGFHGGILSLIQALYYGNAPSVQEGRASAYAHFLALGGISLQGQQREQERLYRSRKQEQQRTQATEEEQQVLRCAMQWWHRCLWSRATFAIRPRRYLLQRLGEDSLSSVSPVIQIGYAPYGTQKYIMSFLHALKTIEGIAEEQALTIARKLHLLVYASSTQEQEDQSYLGYHMGMTDRLMFSCMTQDGRVLFAQGRKIRLVGESIATNREGQPLSRYKGVATLTPYPFLLAPSLEDGKAMFPSVLTHTESAFGPLALFVHGMAGMAWLGQTQVHAQMRQQLQRYSWHILGHDADAPHYERDGTVYFPGERQATALGNALQAQLPSTYRIARIRPEEYSKDMDGWILDEGIGPYQQELIGILTQNEQTTALAPLF